MLLIQQLAFCATLTAAYPQHQVHPYHEQQPGGWTQHDLIGLGPRQEHGVVSLNDQVYIIGGVITDDEGELQIVNRVEYYRISDSTWHVAGPVPQTLNHANVATVEDKLYVLGSLSGGRNWTAQGESFVYHSTNDSWTAAASLPNGTARGSSAVGVWEDTILLAGGMTFLDVAGSGLQDSVAAVSSHNVTSDSWNTEYPPLPQSRQHVGGAVVHGVFYVLGGRESGIEQVRDTVYALDLSNPIAWKTLAPMPTARGGLTCSAVGHEIFCFGGEGNTESDTGVFDQVEVYDIRTDTWTSLDSMPVPRHGTGSAAVGGRIYIPGGGLREAASVTGYFDSFARGA